MRIESLDSPTVPHLQLEGFFYVGIIVLAFFALATQKLVHYPLGFMAVAGVFLFSFRRSGQPCPLGFLLPVLFALVWLPMCFATINAVAPEHSLVTTLSYLHFLPAAYFLLHACSKPGVHFWIQKSIFCLIIFIVLDAVLQFLSGFNLFGYPYDVDANRDNVRVLTGVFYPKERLGLILAGLFPIMLHVLARVRLNIFFLTTVGSVYLFVILMTFKRSAWVMLLIGVAYLLIFFISKRGVLKSLVSIRLILILFFTVSVALLSGSILSDRLSKNLGFFSGDLEQVDVASNHRISLWKTGYEMFKDKPLLGIGPRGFRHAYLEYAEVDNYWLQDGRRGQTHPHSNIVEVFVETGVLGFLGYLCFYGFFVVRFFREKYFTDALAWSLTVLIVWCPLNTHLAFYGSYWSSFAWMLIAISLASFRLQSRD